MKLIPLAYQQLLRPVLEACDCRPANEKTPGVPALAFPRRISAWIATTLLVCGSAHALQPQLRAPWQGAAAITQGNHGPVSHNVCGHRTLDPSNCAWENTYAIDIALTYGSQVLAAADADVTYASDDINPSGGRQMAITSTATDGTSATTVYMHLSAILVYSGHVVQGQPIAKSGASSGGSEYGTTSHLHFHVWAGFGSRDSHTIPIENLLLKRTGVDSSFRQYSENSGDLEHSAIAAAIFESNNVSSTAGASPSGFAVGDRVSATINNPDGNTYIHAGDQGTVTCLFPAGANYDVLVNWDAFINGHNGFGSCAGLATVGHGWAVKKDWIRK